MERPKQFVRFIPPGVLAVSLMAVYLSTIAPGLTWANNGSDGGDYISAAATGGVAHPTGYPLYLLLARLFQFLPVGSLAFRTNLLSTFAVISAAVLLYGLVTRSLCPSDPSKYWLAGFVAGLAFGVAPLIWAQALTTDVHGLHALFVVLLLYLSENPLSVHFTQERKDRLLGLTFGLSMGNHVTTILLLPIILFTTIRRNPTLPKEKYWYDGWQLDGRSLLRRLIWLGGGLLVYLSLPVRALSHPPVNWGNPINLDGFIWLVSGSLYQRLLLNLTFLSFLDRVRAAAALLLGQFGVIGLIVSLIGLIVYFKPNRLYFSMLWIVVVTLAFAFGYATTDAFDYLIPAFVCFAVWIGMGLDGLMRSASSRRISIIIKPLMSLLLILVLLFQAWKNWPQVDASHDMRAESFGKAVLSIAPANAIVFANGDQAVFALWYFQYALRERPDLAILATSLLQFKWYLQTLHSTYPTLNLSAPFPFTETVVEANPDRPVCYVQYDQAAEINCLPASASQSP